MIIGIDARTLMDRQYSGVSEYTLNLVRELLSQDRENSYRLFYNSYKLIDFPRFDAPNVEILSSRYPNKLFNYLLQKTLGIPKLDLACTGTGSKAAGKRVFFAPHLNFVALSPAARSVLTIHDLSFLRYPDFFSARKNFWHKMIDAGKLARRFDRLIALSQNTKRDIVELLGVAEEKITVIHSGISQAFKPLTADDPGLVAVKAKYGLPEKFVFFLGTLEPRKNLPGLIAAYDAMIARSRDLSEYRLVIAGGRGWKSEDIFQAWRRSPNRDRIKFLGYVEPADRVYLYNLASVFVFPSFYEGFGFPSLEAMACGTPVVSSFSSSSGEVAGEAAILVDPFDPAEIARAITQVLSDTELSRRLKEAGLQRAGEFTWQKSAREYLEVFRAL